MLRVRFALSPAGYLHNGRARTFIFNRLYARRCARESLHKLAEGLAENLRALTKGSGLKAGIIINGARAALTRQPAGPSAFHVFTAIERDRAIRRLQAVE